MLYSQEFIDASSQQTPLVILHGLFGSSQNWRQIGKALHALGWPVYLLDLRNHGQSPHFDAMNYSVMSEDVITFLNEKNITQCHLLGHSMGGKVAMQSVLTHADYFASVCIADIAPVEYPPRHQDVFAAINTITQKQPTSRKAADDLVKTILPDTGTRLFLLTNLERINTEGVKWKSNMAAIQANYSEISAVPAACLATSPVNQFANPALILKGEKSNYIKPEYMQIFQKHFTNISLQNLQAGHWLHAEKPSEFIDVVSNFLTKNVSK